MKKQLTESLPEIEEIINKSDICYIGMSDENGQPYVLPFNFGYQDKCIYLHSSQKGKKIDVLKKNPHVCVAFTSEYQLRFQHKDVACSYGMKFKSVVVQGRVEFIIDEAKKADVLNIFMKKYAGKEFSFSAPSLKEVEVYKVVIESATARIVGY